jgi:transposase
MIKNRISGMLDRYPILAKDRPTKELFSQEGRVWLKQLSLKPIDRELMNEDLALLEELGKHLEASEALVERLAADDERVRLLKTVPGFGKFFSVLVAYEVDDIRRFANEKKFCSYMGLVPSTYSSGGRTFHGRLTRQGNKYLRWAFIEAVWPAISGDAELKLYYEGIKSRKAANPAKVSTARRLATIVYRVLSQKRPYEERTVLGSGLPR